MKSKYNLTTTKLSGHGTGVEHSNVVVFQLFSQYVFKSTVLVGADFPYRKERAVEHKEGGER